jgi:energy-coupling factor transport system substrate-specific component
MSNHIFEMSLFAMLGALMFCSKIIMEAFPNIHLLGMLVMLYTVVFRFKALIPIYLYVIVQGIYAGFAEWWIPYLYVWTVLWGMTMLLPKKMPRGVAAIAYPAVCALHGFAFGIIYAPGQALLYGFNFEQTLAWIASGFYFDILHGVSNIFTGMLVLPLSELLKMLLKRSGRHISC